jgi:hypothetical protein
MGKMTDRQFKNQLGVLSMSRKIIKMWKKEYYKKDRDEIPLQFFDRVTNYINKLTNQDKFK